jgi:hypothetical protein
MVRFNVVKALLINISSGIIYHTKFYENVSLIRFISIVNVLTLRMLDNTSE